MSKWKIKNKDTRSTWNPDIYITIENIKQLSTASPININPNTKDLYPNLYYSMQCVFCNKNVKMCAKRQEKIHFEETKKSSEWDSDMREILE